MNPTFSLLSFSLFTILFFFTFHTTSANNNIIQQTCNKSAERDPNINSDFCMASFQAVPGSDSADLSELGMISFKLIQKNVTSTRKYIKEQLKNKGFESYILACLNDCLELYSEAVDVVKEAISEYKIKQYHDADVKLSSIMDASTTCEDGFKENEGVVSPLTDRNYNAFQLTAMALSIVQICSG